MVNMTCCGGIDRNTNVHDQDIPPVETRNCYLSRGRGRSTFEYMNCNGANTACTDPEDEDFPIPEDGGCLACNASSGGGYCKIGNDYYSSKGMGSKFHLLSSDDIADLTRSNASDGLREINRLFQRERQNMINRERQSEIRRRRRSSSSNTETAQEDSTTTEEETTITDYITTTLLYIGISATFIVMILSIVLILLK